MKTKSTFNKYSTKTLIKKIEAVGTDALTTKERQEAMSLLESRKDFEKETEFKCQYKSGDKVKFTPAPNATKFKNAKEVTGEVKKAWFDRTKAVFWLRIKATNGIICYKQATACTAA